MITGTHNNFWQFDINYWFKKLKNSPYGLPLKLVADILKIWFFKKCNNS